MQCCICTTTQRLTVSNLSLHIGYNLVCGWVFSVVNAFPTPGNLYDVSVSMSWCLARVQLLTLIATVKFSLIGCRPLRATLVLIKEAKAASGKKVVFYEC